jgi:RHS repeat-associated protein
MATKTGRPAFGALVAVGAVIGLLAQSVVSIETAAPAAAAPLPWNAAELPALTGSDNTGPLTVPLAGVVVTLGASAVSPSTVPTLEFRADANGREIVFRVLAAADGRVLAESGAVRVNDEVARWTVPPQVLDDRVTYRVSVVEAVNRDRVVLAPTPLTVDTQRTDNQQMHSFSGMGVTLVTGEPVLNWASPGVPTLAGVAGFSLMHRPSNPQEAGLPAGWALHTSGLTSRWESLEVSNRGREAVLTQADGWTVTFELSAGGVFVPLLGAHHSWPGGAYADLSVNADGTYTVVDANQAVTTFPSAGAAPLPLDAVELEPSRSWMDGSPVLQTTWAAHRLVSLDDPVSGRSVRFTYAGSGECPRPETGFAEIPAGMLCRVEDWAGHRTDLSYVSVGAAVQLGRITGRATGGQDAEVTDLAWDASGRVVAMREPLAAAAVAAKVVDGLGAQDSRALTQVTYDRDGRVDTITAPAGLVSGSVQTAAQRVRVSQTMQYRADGGQMVTRVVQPGLSVPFVGESIADLATMEQVEARGPNGCGEVFRSNVDDNTTLARNTCDGTRMKIRYDAQGQPVREIGPSRLKMNTTSGAPVTTTRYDTVRAPGAPVSRPGNPLRGMVLLGYDGATLSGIPSERSVGPVMDGREPRIMSLLWRANPSGSGGQWSGRLSGFFTADRDGKFRFRATSPARMWVAGQSCAGAGCELRLSRGQEVEVRAAFTSAKDGRASFDLLVSRDGERARPIEAADLDPALNQATEQESSDQLSPGRRQSLMKQFLTYDNENGGQLVGQISVQNTSVSYEWAPNTGTGNNYGQRVSATNPGGQTTRDIYYNGEQVADGCGVSANQGGLLKSTQRDGAARTSQVYNAAGQTVKAGGAGTQVCLAYGSSGQAESGLVTGSGADYGLTRDTMVDDNPLVASITVTSQGVKQTMSSSISITGRTFQTVDSWGTTTTMAYDPQTSQVMTSTEVTASDQTRVTNYTYNSLGQQTSIAVDGRVLATNTYTSQGELISTTYANGIEAVVGANDNNNVTSLRYTGFAQNAVLAESRQVSDQGAVLSRTLRGKDGTSTFDYVYNQDHRLIASTITGTIPVTTRSTTLNFSGPSGANGNRQSEKVTTAKGEAATWDYTYSRDDRLLTSTKPGLTTPPTYDATGRTKKLGQTTLAYDAGGNLLSAASPKGTIKFDGDGSTRYSRSGYADVTVKASGSMLLDSEGRISGQLVTLPGGVLVALDSAGAPQRWQYPDLQGSVAWQAAGNEPAKATTVYDPWGQQISKDAPAAIVTPIDLALAMTSSWTGSIRLPNTSDIYVIGAREYSPAAGRFLQPDPVNGGSLNAYEYANGDPINMIDPGGTFSLGKALGLVTGLIVGAVMIVATKGVAAGPVGTLLKGMFAGAVGGLANATAETYIDGGWSANFDWERAAIRMAVGAAVGGLKGALKDAVVGAKVQAVGDKISAAKGRMAVAKELTNAALAKQTSLMNSKFATGAEAIEAKAAVTSAKAAIKSTKAEYLSAKAEIPGLKAELASAGLSWGNTFVIESVSLAGTYFATVGIESLGSPTVETDPGTTGGFSYDAPASGAQLLRSTMFE